MSKRNFILLTIVLVAIVAIVFGFLYFTSSTTTPPTDTDGTNFGSGLTPFGTTPPKNTPTTPPTDISGETPPTSGTDMPKLKLTKVSSVPVAGFGIFQKERFKDVPEVVPSSTDGGPAAPAKTSTAKPTPPPTEVVPAVRYVARATGNIFETFADNIQERKFSTTIIPKVYEAFFGNNGSSVAMRYLKTDERTIETFVGSLPQSVLGGDTTGDNEVKGSYLPENISDMSVSPDGLKLFYIFKSGESAIGTTYEFKTARKTQVFDSPFTEWLSGWPNNRFVDLTTKPSGSVAGYMYAVDLSKKGLTKTLGAINGLTTLTSPDRKLVLFGDNNASLYIYHKDTRESDLLGAKTLPEKCVWGRASDAVYCAVPKSIAAGAYPDSWYKGAVSFSDEIWKIDILSGASSGLVDPLDMAGGEIDGIKLSTDQNENYLFFVNKKDSFLWQLDLSQ